MQTKIWVQVRAPNLEHQICILPERNSFIESYFFPGSTGFADKGLVLMLNPSRGCQVEASNSCQYLKRRQLALLKKQVTLDQHNQFREKVLHIYWISDFDMDQPTYSPRFQLRNQIKHIFKNWELVLRDLTTNSSHKMLGVPMYSDSTSRDQFSCNIYKPYTDTFSISPNTL